MKMKKTSISITILIAAIVSMAVAFAIFGFGQVAAEPTIQDLAAPFVEPMGTFEPQGVDGELEKMTLVGWLNTTQIFINHDLWRDTDNDGVITVDDVYSVEDFAQGTYMLTANYPIYNLYGNRDYYAVSFADHGLYDAVVVQMGLSENNDLANMKPASSYYYNDDAHVLYLKKDLIDSAIEKEQFNTLRSQFVFLVKDTFEFTKEIQFYTDFDESIKDTHGFDKDAVNDVLQIKVVDWEVSSLNVTITPGKYLAYVNADSLNVYVNHAEYSGWTYNEINGQISIDCSPAATRSVVVQVKTLQEPSVAQAILQYCQYESGDLVVNAETTIENALTGNNPFMDYIQYEQAPPQEGENVQLNFLVYAKPDKNGKITVGDQYANGVDKNIVKQAAEEFLASTNKEGAFYQTTTLSAYQTVSWVYARDENGNDIYSSTHLYGAFVMSMFDAYKKHGSTEEAAALSRALDFAQKNLLNSVSTGEKAHSHKALTNQWRVATSGSTKYYGAYITGMKEDQFLGGTVSGNAFFDIICARIDAPNTSQAAALGVPHYTAGSLNNAFDTRHWISRATILKVTQEQNRSDNGVNCDGYVYIAIWAQSAQSSNDGNNHSQRMLAFSRVPYKYAGEGTLSVTKIDNDETDKKIAGAKYDVYDSNGVWQATITTKSTGASDPVTLKIGQYTLVEVEAPLGYTLDPNPINVTIQAGINTHQVVQDPYQQCTFTFYVYDHTMKGIANIPVVGAKFNLKYGADIVDVIESDLNGKVTYTVRARGIYTIEQIATAEYYCLDDDPNGTFHTDCCVDEFTLDLSPVKDIGDFTYPQSGTTLIHYDQRQEVTLKTHVRDINLGASSTSKIPSDPTVHGVFTAGAEYQLYATTDLFLGYKNGNKVVRPASTTEPIEVESDTTPTIVVSKDINNKAYLTANYIWYDGVKWPLPNGTYEWRQTQSSDGYVTDGNSVSIPMTWTNDTSSLKYFNNETAFVSQTRQAVTLDFTTKTYKDSDRNVEVSPEYTNKLKADSELISLKDTDRNGKIDKIDFSYKTVFSTLQAIANNSREYVVAHNDVEMGGVQIAIEAKKLLPNAVYGLYNISPIVDIKTGKLISPSIDKAWIEGIHTTGEQLNVQALGYYLTNADGAISITVLGSEAFENPNNDTRDSLPIIPKCDPITDPGKSPVSVYGNPIPNGEYYLGMIIAPDGHIPEDILADDYTSDTLLWEKGEKSKSASLNMKLDTYLLDVITDPEPGTFKLIVAPNAPINDKYDRDPQTVSVENIGYPRGDSSLENFITTDWIYLNSKNTAYRIADIDVGNLDSDGVSKVKDTMPTTFAYYLKQDSFDDPNYWFEYDVEFYYEDTEMQHSNGDGCLVLDGVHLKKFMLENEYDKNDESQLLLSSVLTLNPNSPGYDGVDSLVENKAIAGMIRNTEWLNDQLKAKEDGKYQIFIKVTISTHYYAKILGVEIVQNNTTFCVGNLTIRNRNLVNLD